MSIGFHYFEAIKQSLSLQWLSKEEAPIVLGKLLAVGSLTSLRVYGCLWALLEIFQLPYWINFVIAGGICILLAIVMYFSFPAFPSKVEQNQNLVLREEILVILFTHFFVWSKKTDICSICCFSYG